MQSSKQQFFPTSPWLIAVNAGLLLIVAGTALPLLHFTGLWVRIIYSLGAATVLIARLFGPLPKNLPFRARRLCRMEISAGLIFVVGAFFMWYQPDRMDWIAFTLAGAVVQIYTSLTLPKAMAEENSKN